MDKFTLLKNYDDTYTLIIYLDTLNYEFADDFFGKSLKKVTDSKYFEKYRKYAIKTVRFVLAGGVVISVPFSGFVSGKEDKNYAVSYVYFGSVAEQIENVKKSVKSIDTVAPSYFDLSSEGKLNLSGLSPSFVDEMHKEGIKVVPFLSNHWNKTIGNKALDNRAELAREIAFVIEKYNLDGVNVDIENVDHTYREKYTDFVRLLREYIPKSKEVSVAVAANPYGWSNGWQGSYDYEELSKYADYLMVMSYDEHYDGGEEGPVASIDFVRDSIEYALEYVPEEKIVMGVPFYGRLWGGDFQGRGISLNRADELLSLFNARVFFDEESKSPVATFTVYENSPEFKINGKILKPGNYTLWYEDETSLALKMKLIEDYGIKGAGNWSSGQEKDNIWDYYELWVKGIYFNDIAEHFAKDDIIKIYSEGVMVGKGTMEFQPQRSITRGEMAVILGRIFDIKPAEENTFTDTKGHFAEKYINAIAEKGYMKGYPDGSFKPDLPVSRMEAAVILSRIVELDYRVADTEYTDVNNKMWSFGEITALTEAGIMKGYSDGTFRPHNPVTRGEMAALLTRIE